MGDFVNENKTAKSSSDLRTFLDGHGVTEDKSVITHCYVGYRAGQEYFMLRLVNATVSSYDGSWAEWAADPSTPKSS